MYNTCSVLLTILLASLHNNKYSNIVYNKQHNKHSNNTYNSHTSIVLYLRILCISPGIIMRNKINCYYCTILLSLLLWSQLQMTGSQCPGPKCAIRVSPGSVPRGSQALSTPCRRCLLPDLSGLLWGGRPSLLQLTSESLRPRFVLSSESLSATPTCAQRNSTDIGRVAVRD
jgi:hypothetical protein